MNLLRSHNNKTCGGLGRSIEHMKFPKFQTASFGEWKAPSDWQISFARDAQMLIETCRSFFKGNGTFLVFFFCSISFVTSSYLLKVNKKFFYAFSGVFSRFGGMASLCAGS